MSFVVSCLLIFPDYYASDGNQLLRDCFGDSLGRCRAIQFLARGIQVEAHGAFANAENDTCLPSGFTRSDPSEAVKFTRRDHKSFRRIHSVATKQVAMKVFSHNL
jgi:hypothetical protein